MSLSMHRSVGHVTTLAVMLTLAAAPPVAAQGSSYSLPQVLGFPFANDLVASAGGQHIAWTLMQRGERSIWVADGPDFAPRRLLGYPDDGQELTNLSFTGDGSRLVYTRGGDHGSNWPAQYNLMPNPASSPIEPKLQIWSVPTDGSAEPMALAEGDDPVPSPADDRVAFEKGREIWVVPADGQQPAGRMFFTHGSNGSPVWSPDGKTLAFVSNRGDYGFIGLYTSDDQPIRYLAPSTSFDGMPRWSPNGTRIAFVRRPGRGGPAESPLEQRPSPWAIWVADVGTGAAHEVWQSPETLWGSVPRTLGGPNLLWAAGDRLVFLADLDGWPHLYSVPVTGGDPLLLTPGSFMVEYVTLAPDRRSLVYNANTGSDPNDSERRHIFRVPVDAAKPVALTSGAGIEWAPVVTGDGSTLACVRSTAQQPPLVSVRAVSGGTVRAINQDRIPADFPGTKLLTPEHVTFKAADGTTVHGQLFKAAAGAPQRPGVVFVHGGPPRQMLLGWHYMFYYSNSYAVNQYLASQGYVVLSVNYRLGIGYGHDFHNPPHAGARGASEYQDVLAGGKYLQARPDVDPARVGIWGGSYGGFLTAMALGRNSDVFAAGVDMHGVHYRVNLPSEDFRVAAAVGDGVTPQDQDEIMRVAWESSPDAWVKTWKSPVLLVHGDDDRNVRIEQTVDLAQRLQAAGVEFEEMIIPDEIHDFLLYRSWLRADQATVDFFNRKLKGHAAEAGHSGRP